MAFNFSRTLLVLSLLIAVFSKCLSPVSGQENSDIEVYETAWKEVSDLLRRREFGSALGRLDSLTRSEDLREFSEQIEADRKAVIRLQVLERIVTKRVEQLSDGGTIKVSGIEYTVDRIEKSTRGDVLVLSSKALRRQTRKLIADLPSGTWVELAQADLSSLPDPELTLGIFLAFDRVGDQKTARKLLNEAAAGGEDVSIWLARLESTKNEKPPGARDGSDPIVGPWSGRFGPPDHAVAATYEFRRNGTGVMKIDPGLLATWKAPPGHKPGEWAAKKSLLRGGMSFEWEHRDDDTYKITFKLGGVTFEGFVLEGETLRLPGYPVFTRPARK